MSGEAPAPWMERWEWPDDMSEMESEQMPEAEEEEEEQTEPVGPDTLPGVPRAARERTGRWRRRGVVPLVLIAVLLALALVQLRSLPAAAPAQPQPASIPPPAPVLAPGTGSDEVLAPQPPSEAGSPGLPPWAPARGTN